ncbi:MAG: S-layer homology domain-containing protein [Clostridiales bacterium]|nr:S-layer homology domain-containing protein [Clostridiales bacterium]
MKRFLSFILALTLAVSLVPSAFAASDEAVQAANALHTLGLFNGTGTDANGNPIYDLDRAPTREEAITMLIRLMGKESDAKGYNWEMPFTDVSGWAKPYVGAAYYWGLTSGTSETTFGGKQKVSAMQYLTFVLRALDYEDGTDFQWDKAWELSDKIALTSGQYTSDRSITRGDVAIISLKALSISNKYNWTLLEQLLNEEIISQKMVKKSGIDIIPDFNSSSTRFQYVKDRAKFYRLCDGTFWSYTSDDYDDDFFETSWMGISGIVEIYFDKYTGDSYVTLDTFAALNTLFSGDYNRMICASDSKTSQFASGVVWLTQRNIGCAYRVQRKEVSLNNYKSEVSVAYKSKDLKYSLTEAESNSSIDWTETSKIEKALSRFIYQQTGVKCKVEKKVLPYQYQLDSVSDVYGYQPVFNVHGLLDYFGITDPVIRDKFENIQVKNIDGTDVLIVN